MFSNLEDLVIRILQTDRGARNSDNKLYLAVIDNLVLNGSQLPISEVLLNQKRLGIPPFESVSRCRRRLQSVYPNLRGNDEVLTGRRKKERAFKDYYRRW